MAWRMVVRQPGGPEVLERETFDPGAPGPGDVLLEQEAIGLNFIDIYQRSGLYPAPLPLVPGSEAAGVVRAVGDGVTLFRPGDRVGYPQGGSGAYATHRLIAADRLVRLPESLSSEDAAAILLKGCTVEMLVERCARVQKGEWVLVHAAAGGVGSLLVPWLAAIGARVIAHAGHADKAARARAAGAEVALSCAFADLAEAVKDATGGAGVRTVFDGVGAASWEASLGALARRGLLVSFGNASGPAPAIAPLALMRGGSLFLTRPTLGDYLATRADLEQGCGRLFEMVAQGSVPLAIGRRFALADAAEAHRALAARETQGASILRP
ncbi:quinone oxidoreductase family protein [Sphingomonas morindae]|uniref:Quinone oxidoreductase n=1 Tax=Sphingomonas morindae TaxID=1541170 RepID=A0ABY4XBV1_9SPHN|nr:quinone oxidoreductase [Sphingomonas morindae]USI74299.1 quinone oxidoreductase [Sphingomonas morindae]